MFEGGSASWFRWEIHLRLPQQLPGLIVDTEMKPLC